MVDCFVYGSGRVFSTNSTLYYNEIPIFKLPDQLEILSISPFNKFIALLTSNGKLLIFKLDKDQIITMQTFQLNLDLEFVNPKLKSSVNSNYLIIYTKKSYLSILKINSTFNQSVKNEKLLKLSKFRPFSKFKSFFLSYPIIDFELVGNDLCVSHKLTNAEYLICFYHLPTFERVKQLKISSLINVKLATVTDNSVILFGDSLFLCNSSGDAFKTDGIGNLWSYCEINGGLVALTDNSLYQIKLKNSQSDMDKGVSHYQISVEMIGDSLALYGCLIKLDSNKIKLYCSFNCYLTLTLNSKNNWTVENWHKLKNCGLVSSMANDYTNTSSNDNFSYVSTLYSQSTLTCSNNREISLEGFIRQHLLIPSKLLNSTSDNNHSHIYALISKIASNHILSLIQLTDEKLNENGEDLKKLSFKKLTMPPTSMILISLSQIIKATAHDDNELEFFNSLTVYDKAILLLCSDGTHSKIHAYAIMHSTLISIGAYDFNYQLTHMTLTNENNIILYGKNRCVVSTIHLEVNERIVPAATTATTANLNEPPKVIKYMSLKLIKNSDRVMPWGEVMSIKDGWIADIENIWSIDVDFMNRVNIINSWHLQFSSCIEKLCNDCIIIGTGNGNIYILHSVHGVVYTIKVSSIVGSIMLSDFGEVLLVGTAEGLIKFEIERKDFKKIKLLPLSISNSIPTFPL